MSILQFDQHTGRLGGRSFHSPHARDSSKHLRLVLAEVRSWQRLLSCDLRTRKGACGRDELHAGVGRLVIGLLFLRLCEERGAEPCGGLAQLLEGARTGARLAGRFLSAARKYHCGLLDFGADGPGGASLDWFDDEALRRTIQRLYPPRSSFDFRALPADVLGTAYERLQDGWESASGAPRTRGARRARGVYYTPASAVQYVVRHTVGELTRDRTPAPRGGALRILDPACGCGAFLLAAYRHLMDWHHACAGHRTARDRAGEGGAVRDAPLTRARRARILLDSIYGVDLDPLAVEVARLSLILMFLDEAGGGGAPRKFGPVRELPDLSSNIKCGDSLVGPAFHDGSRAAARDEVRAFDWPAEFPEVFKARAGGFDAVIGNPPYVSFYSRESARPPAAVESYLSDQFGGAVGGRLNTFLMFLEQGMRLKSAGGQLGMILPDTLARNRSYEAIRRRITEAGLSSVAHLAYGVFPGVTVGSIIAIVGPPRPPCGLRVFCDADQLQADRPAREFVTTRRNLLEMPQCRWFSASASARGIMAEMEADSVPLDTLAEVRDGINPGPRAVRQRILNPAGSRRPTWRAVLAGRHIRRYELLPTSEIIDYDPALLSPDLRRRGASLRNPRIFSGPKLVSRQTADRLIFALDEVGLCTLNSAHNTLARDGHRETLLLLLGLLNSRLMSRYYRERFRETRRVFPQVHISALRQLPVPAPDASDARRRATRDRLVRLVERRVASAGVPPNPAAPRAACEAAARARRIEAEIERVVRALYGLAETETAMVDRAG